MPKDVVNAYGIGDGEKGKSQEITIIDCFGKLKNFSKTRKNNINSRIESRLKTNPKQ